MAKRTIGMNGGVDRRARLGLTFDAVWESDGGVSLWSAADVGSKRERLFVLAELVVECIALEGERVRVSARSSSPSASCPCCGRAAQRVHSRNRRRLADLPAHGRRVKMVIMGRCFRRPHAFCARRVLAERLDQGATVPHERRTRRLDGVVNHLGVALGVQPARAIAQRRLLPVSNDTLLRIVGRRAPATPSGPRL
jgi:hypothetical protein